MFDAFAFQYTDLVTGNEVTIPINRDTAGNFTVTFPVNGYQEVQLSQGTGKKGSEIKFGGLSQFRFYVKPGEDINLNFYNSKDYKRREIIFKGNMADANNQKEAYTNLLTKSEYALHRGYDLLDSLKPDGYHLFKSLIAKRLKAAIDFNANYFKGIKADPFLKTQMDIELKYHSAALISQALLRTNQSDPDLLNFFKANGILLNNPAAFGNNRYKTFLDQYYLILKDEARKSKDTFDVTYKELAKYLLREHRDFSSTEIEFLKKLTDTVVKPTGDEITHFNNTYTQRFANEYLNGLDIKLIFDRIAENNDPFVRDIYLTKLLRKELELNEFAYINGVIEPYKKIVNDNPVTKQFLKDYYQGYNAFYKSRLSPKSIINDAKALPEVNLLAGIVDKYKGKVVYVDVWATWCLPCREEMANSKKLREKLVGKDVVFLYLCINSPSESAWKGLIFTHQIEGENYFLNFSQSDGLTKQFGIKAIPRYMIVDKVGNLVNKQADTPMNNNTLSQINSLLE